MVPDTFFCLGRVSSRGNRTEVSCGWSRWSRNGMWVRPCEHGGGRRRSWCTMVPDTFISSWKLMTRFMTMALPSNAEPRGWDQ